MILSPKYHLRRNALWLEAEIFIAMRRIIHGSPRTLKILFAAWIGGDELSGATQDSGLCLYGRRTGEGAEKLDREQGQSKTKLYIS
jgi:hypothetical protein